MLFLKRERRLNKAAAGHPFYEDFVPLCLINSPSIFHRELRTHLYSKDDLSTILSEAKKRSWVTKISPAPPITQKIIYAYQIFPTFFMPKKLLSAFLILYLKLWITRASKEFLALMLTRQNSQEDKNHLLSFMRRWEMTPDICRPLSEMMKSCRIPPWLAEFLIHRG